MCDFCQFLCKLTLFLTARITGERINKLEIRPGGSRGLLSLLIASNPWFDVRVKQRATYSIRYFDELKVEQDKYEIGNFNVTFKETSNAAYQMTLEDNGGTTFKRIGPTEILFTQMKNGVKQCLLVKAPVINEGDPQGKTFKVEMLPCINVFGASY